MLTAHKEMSAHTMKKYRGSPGAYPSLRWLLAMGVKVYGPGEDKAMRTFENNLRGPA